MRYHAKTWPVWSAIARVVLCSVLLWAAFSAIPPQVMAAVTHEGDAPQVTPEQAVVSKGGDHRRAPPIVVEEQAQCRSAGAQGIQYSNTTALSDFKRKSYGAFMTFPTTPLSSSWQCTANR